MKAKVIEREGICNVMCVMHLALECRYLQACDEYQILYINYKFGDTETETREGKRVVVVVAFI